tara:strand:+ start:959 stop:1396 length:438 start_codon:yes stop_codon:yes gene_type:complete
MRTRFFQAEITDISRVMELCENFSQDMQSLNYPAVDKPTLENFLIKWLGMGKIILAENLEDKQLVGMLLFYKTRYYWSVEKVTVIHVMYVKPENRGYKMFKQLLEMVKQVSKNTTITWSTTTKINEDKLFEKVGFEKMGNNWRLN